METDSSRTFSCYLALLAAGFILGWGAHELKNLRPDGLLSDPTNGIHPATPQPTSGPEAPAPSGR